MAFRVWLEQRKPPGFYTLFPSNISAGPIRRCRDWELGFVRGERVAAVRNMLREGAGSRDGLVVNGRGERERERERGARPGFRMTTGDFGSGSAKMRDRIG